MKFILTTIFFMAQAILLAVAMQPNSTDSSNKATDAYGCYESGIHWSDLGTNEAILAEYDEQWCKDRLGLWPLGDTDNLCVRDGAIAHAFLWKWTITKIPDGQQYGYVTHDVCICFLAQALNLCDRGGEMDLVCGPGTDGGDAIGMWIKADPQDSFAC